jgi:hypothetical protein
VAWSGRFFPVPYPSVNPRIPTLLILAAALALAALGLVRAADLATHGWQPRGPGETRWFEWAWGTAEDRALVPAPFRVAEPHDLAPEAPVYLTDPPPGARPFWVQVMTQYALPGHPVAGIGPAAENPGAATLSAATAPLVTPISAPLATRLLELLSLSGGLALTVLLGWLLRPGLDPVATPLLGLTAIALLAAVAGLTGLPPAAFPVASLLLLAWLVWRRFRTPGSWAGQGKVTVTFPLPTSRLGRFVLAVAAGLTALFVARTFLAPIWSWDHFAIWGLKARRIVHVGAATGLFTGPGNAFDYANTDYPLGLPLAWVQLAPFAEPGGWLFRITHGLFGALLVAAVYPLACRLGASRPLAMVAAAWTAASPLLFDTETLGLAELPLALWLVAGVGLALRASDASPTDPRTAGVLLGFLPWIKPEGLPLAALAVGALWLAGPASRHWRFRLALPAALLAVVARVHVALVGGEGKSFFAGGAADRFLERLQDPGPILTAMGRELTGSGWLGLWLVFPVVWIAVLVVALRNDDRSPRRHPAAVLGVIVPVQMGLYLAAYLATYLDPLAHVASSFGRIAAVFGPLATAVVAGGTEKLLRSTGSESSDSW